jgi:anti-sigma-K factor RskA
MDRNDLLDLIPAYALGALDAEERAAVESLLATDAEAQQLLAEYQGVAETLMLTAPARPAPAHLQADLKTRLAAQREVTTGTRESVPTARPTLQKRSIPLWMPLFAAAAALVVIVGGILLSRPAGDPSQQQYAVIVALAGAQTFPVASGATGEAVIAPDGRAALRLTDLPAVTDDRVLQLWLVKADGTVTAGALYPWRDPQGVYYTTFTTTPEVQALAFSIEAPEGRTSEQGPSDTPVILVPVVNA